MTPYYNALRNRRLTTNRLATKGGSMRAPQNQQNFGGNFLSDLDEQQVAGLLAQGLSSYGEARGETHDYSIDGFAGLKGGAKGFATGGVPGAVIGAVAGQVGTFAQVNKNLKGLETGVNLMDTSATGQPIYLGGAYNESNDKVEALKAGERSLQNDYISGGSAPLLDKIFGTTDKIRKKRRAIIDARTTAQQDFNSRRERFNQQQINMTDYFERQNIEDQLYNLYK